MRAKVIRFDMSHGTSSRFIGVDVQRVQPLAVIPQWGEFTGWIGNGDLDAKIKEPGVNVGVGCVGKETGKEFVEKRMHD